MGHTPKIEDFALKAESCNLVMAFSVNFRDFHFGYPSLTSTNVGISTVTNKLYVKHSVIMDQQNIIS